MSREVAEVSNYLKTKHINIPADNEWLTSCVECFKEQGNYSFRELKELVYQQWLLADLSDIGVQVIPNNCFTEDKFVLEGKYAVQFNYFVNVAVSFHKQLQQRRRPDALKNLDVDSETHSGTQSKSESSGSRILKIELTDGVVTIMGFEDQYISSLQEPYVPGKKGVLVGPIECRKRVLFLKPKNIILLGGEVDALLIPNASENLLARQLKLPENPDPYSEHLFNENVNTAVEDPCLDDDDEAMMMLAEVIEKKVPDTSSSGRSRYTYPQNNFSASNNNSNLISKKSQKTPCLSEVVQSQFAISTQTSSSQFSCQNNSSQLSNTSQQTVFTIPHQTTEIGFDDDFDLLEIETAASAEENQLGKKKEDIDDVASKFNTYEIFDSTSVKKDLKKINDLKQKLNESYGNESPSSNSSFGTLQENKKVVVDYLSDNVSPLINLPYEPDLDAGINSSISNIDYSENGFSLEPFPPRKRPSIVTAFTRVVKVVKKPKLKGDKWTVSALVEAKGMEVEATFESDVIDKVFTVTAAEIVSRREELTSDPFMKQKMNEALKESQSRFSKLACDMTFNFKDSISNPVIIDVKVKR